MKGLKLLLIAAMVGNFQWCFAQLQIVTTGLSKYETGQAVSLTVNNASSTVNYIKYYWDFGDGEALETTNLQTLHTFKKSGTFRVTLVGESPTGPDGRVTRSLNLYETVGINFNTVPNSLSPCGLDVEFFDKSYDAVDWWWDFDNNPGVDSRAKNPVHSYTTPGIYSVSLTIETSLGVIEQKTFDHVVVHDCVGSTKFRQILPPSLDQCSSTPRPYISAIGSVAGGNPGGTLNMPVNAPNPNRAYQYRNYVWLASDFLGNPIPMFDEPYLPETYLDLSDNRIQDGFNTSGEYTVNIELRVSDYSAGAGAHIISNFSITLYKPMVISSADINICPASSDQLVGSWPMYSSQGGHSLLTHFKLKDQNGVEIPSYSGLGTNPVMKVPDNSNETYTVEVTVQDRAGCTSTRTTSINAKDVEVDIGDDFMVCFNQDNRKMDPSVSGGTGSFTSYNWSPATWLDDHQKRDPTILATTNNVSNTYTLVVTDSKECIGADQVTVTSNQTSPSITLPADEEYCMVQFNAGGPTQWGVSSANPVFYYYDPTGVAPDLPLVTPLATSSIGNRDITWMLNGSIRHTGDQFIPENLYLGSVKYFQSSQTYTARITEDMSGCYAEDAITISAKQKPHFAMKDVLNSTVGGLCQELYLCATGTNPTWIPTYDLTHIDGHSNGLTQASYNITNRQWLEQLDNDLTDPSSTKVAPEILNANQTIPTVKLERSLTLTQSITLTSGCSAVSRTGVSIVVSKGVPDADFTVAPCIRSLNEIYVTNNTDYKTHTPFMECQDASTPSNFGVVWSYGLTGLPTSNSTDFTVPGANANPGTENPFQMPRTDMVGFSNQGSKTITMQATNTCGTSVIAKTFTVAPNAPTVSPLLQICHPSFNDPNEQAAMVIQLSESCTSTNILANDKGHFLAADFIAVKEGFRAHVGSDVWLRIDGCMIPPPPAPHPTTGDQDPDESKDVVKYDELNIIEEDALPEIDPALNEVTDFDVFPNPSGGHVEIRVQGDISENDVIYVVNIYGSTVMEVALSSKVQLDLSTVSKGLYFVVLKNGTTIRGIKKVVMQ